MPAAFGQFCGPGKPVAGAVDRATTGTVTSTAGSSATMTAATTGAAPGVKATSVTVMSAAAL